MIEQTNYQDSNWVTQKAIKQLTENKNRRISAMFREFRAYPHYSLLGDYILLACIAGALRELQLPFMRSQMGRALNQSEELKERARNDKGWLLDELEKIVTGETETGKRPSSRDTIGA